MKIPLKSLATFILALSMVGAQAYDNSCGNGGQNNDCPGDGANPINSQKGNLMREVTDLQTFGAAPIVFSRFYNSRTRDYTKPRWELGTAYTWQHNWQYEVRESSTADFGFPRLIIRYPQGREYYFRAVDATGSVRVSDASWGDRLYPTGTGTYTLRTPAGQEYDFRKVGSGSSYQYLLDQVRNGTGWKWMLTYQTQADGYQRLYRITNNYGRYLQLNRTAGANGYYQITSVAANDGRSVSYGYTTWTSTSETVLISVTYPDATAAAYTWCGSSSATSGPPLLATANDPMKSDAGSRMKYTYNYTAAYFTPPYGIVNGTVYEERSLVTNNVVVSLPLGSGEQPKVIEGNGTELGRLYDQGLIKQMADGEGRVTTLTRDSGGAGYVLSVAAPGGRTGTFTRDYAGRVLTCTNPESGVRTYTYNANGFLLTDKDELNRTTTYTRDTSNRVTRIDFPDTAYETFTYTGTGLLKTHRLRNGITETLNYDSWGNLSSLVDATGQTWNYTYFTNGLRASKTDPRSYATSYQYNWRGLLTRVTHPDTTYREYAYSTYGKRTSDKDELGHTWTSSYTEYNQLASVTDPLSHTTGYQYGREPGCGMCGYLPTLTRVTLPSGKTTEYHYDASGRLTSYVIAPGTADESTTSYARDSAGRIATMTDPRGKTTTYTYDLLDRRLTQADPLSHTTAWAYDAVGNILTTTRADSSVFTNTYDAMNRLLTANNPNNETTTYTYYADGSPASLKDARNNTYTFTVDGLSRRTRMTYPGGSYENWTFDGAGNMTIYRARNAATKTCTYDSRNRETLADWSDSTPDVSTAYDNASRVSSLTGPNATLTYTYDDANEMLGETAQITGLSGTKVVSYGYDVDGNRSTMTYPDASVVGFSYTMRNQVSAVAVGGSSLATFAYDAAGNRISKALANGTSTGYDYDDAGNLGRIAHQHGVPTVISYEYGYDAIDRRTSQDEDSGGADGYGYDAADQLISVDYNSGRSVDYAYDPTGNRTSVADSTFGNSAYGTADALNQYSAFGSMGTVSYDASGNTSGLQSNTPTGTPAWLFSYDSANRLISGSGGPPSFAFSFVRDARNRVVKRTITGTTTYQIYDGWNLLAEYDASGTLLAKYIHGPKTDELLTKTDSSGTVYYHENALGSISALTNASGNLIERYSYDVYGAPTFMNASSTVIPATAYGNRFLFTGREWFSQLALYDYRNRMYSPQLGRFLQTDPIRFDAEDVNIYRYVFNNPVGFTDPTGEGASGSRDQTSDGRDHSGDLSMGLGLMGAYLGTASLLTPPPIDGILGLCGLAAGLEAIATTPTPGPAPSSSK